MRDQYIQFILDNKISDILSGIIELSFSQKMFILQELLERYSVNAINIALYIYKKDYIDLKRVKLMLIRNTLKNLCERQHDNNES